LVLDEHRQYLSDLPRISALDHAIRETVRLGHVVLDLGCGTGILGLMACRAGASRVYSIEEGGMVELARSICEANGYGDRVTFIQSHSSRTALPERVDVVVADQIGRFGFEAGLLQLYPDACERFLKPGGVLIPSWLEMLVAPIECPEVWERPQFWTTTPANFNYEPARTVAFNTGYPFKYKPEHLLGKPAVGASLDTATRLQGPVRIDVSLSTTRSGTLHGIGGWFSARLSKNVTMTNSPIAKDPIARMNVFFPIDKPTQVVEGQCIDLRMTILPNDLVVSWNVRIAATPDGIGGSATFNHSTLHGMLVTRDELRRTRPDAIPKLNPWGAARLSVLSLCDGRRTLGEIEKEIQLRHPDLFPSRDASALFIAEVITRYGV
jgi:protein arginine N-methyltransferase 1